MSFSTRQSILQAVNAGVAVNYMLLAVAFAAIFLVLREITDNDRRTGHVAKWVVGTGITGTAMFLAGCGIHHAHHALETIPGAYRQGALPVDVFVGDGQFEHHLLIDGAQLVGGWLLLVAFAAAIRVLGRQQMPRADTHRA